MKINGNNKIRIASLILIVVLALGAGVVGELLARTYLAGSSFGLPLYGDLDFATGGGRSNLVIRTANKVVVQQNDRIAETVSSARSSLAGIYKKQTAADAKAFSLSNFYQVKDAVGQCLILTSDGWLVTNLSGLGDKPTDAGGFVVVTEDKKNYPIDKIIKDKFSKFVFLHIPAIDLPVRKFVEPGDLSGGQLALLVSWNGSSWVTTISDASSNEDGEIRSSDISSDRIVLVEAPGAIFSAPAMFNLAGDIAGLVGADGKIESITHFTAVIDSLFKFRAARRPSLGFNYLSGGSLIGVDAKINEQFSGLVSGSGAVIARGEKGIAVAKGGPADLAGLKEGDIILSIDGNEITKDSSLTDIIETLAIGDSVLVDYQRAGVKKQVEVKVGELK